MWSLFNKRVVSNIAGYWSREEVSFSLNIESEILDDFCLGQQQDEK